MPFAKAIALSFTVPLFATAGAALILGEDVRARRWTATIIGFIGVLIILHPGFGGSELTSSSAAALGAGLSLLAALLSAVITLIVKDLSRTEPSDAIVTYMVLLLTPMSLIPAHPVLGVAGRSSCGCGSSSWAPSAASAICATSAPSPGPMRRR